MHKKHYHLIGICGTAMASLAGMLAGAGHRVTGSDENVYPPMSLELERLGIPVTAGYLPNNLGADNAADPPDVVVVGNAITRGNPELEYMLNQKMYYTSMASVVKDCFIRGRKSIVVAGTHGKTTTTSLMAWALECAGVNPSFLIGGVAENFDTSFRVTDSPYFVIEGDEYDTAYFDKGPKFMHYLPDLVILNNVEYDHADIYRDLEAIRIAFARLVNLIPSQGSLIAGWDSELVPAISQRAFCPVESFGTGDKADWQAQDIDYGAEITTFRVTRSGGEFGRYEMPLAGGFNVRNCLAVIAACHSLGLDREAVAMSLSTFKSVKRRMEVRGLVRGVTVIDDFAHHPTAVRETLAAARLKYPGKRIVAVFEPRSYTAQLKQFQADFETGLGIADRVIISGLFHPERYSKETGLNPFELVDALTRSGHEAVYLPEVDRIVADLAENSREGDVILIMSNGSFGGIHGKVLKALGGL